MRPSMIALVVSMLALIPVVNTFAEGTPTPKADLKDSVKDSDKKDLAQLIDFLLKNGNDVQIGEDLGLAIGLPGARPAKSKAVRNKINGKDRDALNCALIYEETTDASVPGSKKPTCIYLMKVADSPRIKVSQFFRINLNGQLERVITNRAKRDDEGKIIPGAGVELDDDKDSSAVRKTYTAELHEVRAWLKQQLKLAAKTTTASAAKPEDAVRASAETASAAVDREASAAPSESTTQ
jgi:hypothetical protein